MPDKKLIERMLEKCDLGKYSVRPIGATLALGAKGVLERRPGLKPIVLHIKGLEQSAYDCRGASSMALAYGTSDIWGHHTRAWTVGQAANILVNL